MQGYSTPKFSPKIGPKLPYLNYKRYKHVQFFLVKIQAQTACEFGPERGSQLLYIYVIRHIDSLFLR